jgi:hypothetical protein
MTKQLNNDGLVVRLPGPCVCRAIMATVISGNRLCCANCGARRGKLSPETQRFITEVVKLFDRPSTPIIIREGRS